MPDRINRIQRPLPPKGGQRVSHNQAGDFAEKLAQELKRRPAPQFSGHALSRIANRRIRVTKSQLERLGKGVEIARDKGCRDSLVLVDKLAFVVSVKNSRVITAIEGDDLKERIFTNIDSAVLI